jgi:predicted RNA-binding protein
MSRLDRARQFLPFDALKGFQEALREKEKEYVERIDLDDEQKAILSEQLARIEINNNIKLTYYSQRQYKTISGYVNGIDTIKKKIAIDDNKISFYDILKIEIF